eukprot:jgi/Mesvir1/1513/Mv14496-RA.1
MKTLSAIAFLCSGVALAATAYSGHRLHVSKKIDEERSAGRVTIKGVVDSIKEDSCHDKKLIPFKTVRECTAVVGWSYQGKTGATQVQVFGKLSPGDHVTLVRRSETRQ